MNIRLRARHSLEAMRGLKIAALAALQLLCTSAFGETASNGIIDTRALGGHPQIEPRLFRHLDELIVESDRVRDEVEQLREIAVKSNDNNRVIECLRSPDRQTARARRLAYQWSALARDSARRGQVDDARQLEQRVAFQVAVLRWGAESARQCAKLSRHQSVTEVRVTIDPTVAGEWLAFGQH